MNLREGMRRVGILLGAVGSIAGGVLGYGNLKTVWASHTKFERLQSLPVVHAIVTCATPYKKFFREELFPKLAPEKKGEERGLPTAISWGKPVRAGYPIPVPVPPPEGYITGVATYDEVDPSTPMLRRTDLAHKITANDFSAELTVDARGDEGVETVNVDASGAISSIGLTTGEWIHREPRTLKARSAFAARLLLSLCFPIVGFLVPWGAIRVLVWVGSGFSATRA